MQLDELSKELLARYKKKAAEQASAADKAGDFEKGNKRFSGIVKATKKQFDKPKTESRLDKDGTPVPELTPESTKLKEDQMNPMDLYLAAIQQGVGVLTTTQEVVESVKAKQELDEAKIPVQHATDVVHGILGQSGAVRFLNHLRPGTEKHTSWDKINASLTKQGVKSQHIADIASKLKPAQYKEEVELDDEEAERKAKFKAALAATDHVAKGGMQKKGYTGSTYNPQKKVQKEEVELDEAMTELQKKVAISKLASRNSARRSRINTSGTHNEKLAQQKDDIAKQKKYNEEVELDEAMKPLPRRHFFQSYGVEGHGIAHDGKENHWKFENNKPVAHTKDPEVVAGWKRDLAAKSRANEEVELDEEQKIKVSDIKAALKNVKNASDHTKKMIKANPTQKMPHDSSRHAAYSEETELNESGQGFSGESRAKVKEMGLAHAKEVHGSDVKEHGEDRYGETHFRNAKKEKVATLKHDGMGGYHMHVYDKPIKDLKEETKLTFAQFIVQMNEAAKVKDKDVITSGKNKIALHQGEEDGSRVAEELKGNQHKLDKNKNGKLDAHDFKLLRKEEQELDESILGDKNDGAYKAGHQPKGRVVKGKSYGAEYNDDEDEKKAAPSGEKRGRGRPKKGADQSGEVKKYNFHDLLNRLSR